MQHDSRIYVDKKALINLRLKTRGFSLSASQPVNSILAGKHASRIRGRGLNFAELRQYRIGDDIRSMDWKVSNRLRKPYVRVYDEEKERQVYFLIDQSQAMFFGSQHKMKSVVAAELAALSCWKVLDAGDKAGAIIFNDKEVLAFKAQRSEKQLLAIFSAMQRLNHKLKVASEKTVANKDEQESKGGLLNALKYLAALKPQNALIVVISDFLDSDNSYCLAKMAQFRLHNDVIAAQVVEHLELSLAKNSHFVASDGELQIVVDGQSESFAKHYQQEVDSNMQGLLSYLKRHRIPLLAFNTIDDVDVQLRALLGAVPK
jgi:uncharacterized protein (DUF58 family)